MQSELQVSGLTIAGQKINKSQHTEHTQKRAEVFDSLLWSHVLAPDSMQMVQNSVQNTE